MPSISLFQSFPTLMNLYQTIRTNYGQSTIKTLTNCDKIERKISHFRNHRVFTLRCRDQSLTPPSLRLKCNTNSDNARKIIRNAEKQLVRERIRVIGKKLDFLQRKRSQINDDLSPGQRKQSHHRTSRAISRENIPGCS